MVRRDYLLGIIAGILIGVFVVPLAYAVAPRQGGGYDVAFGIVLVFAAGTPIGLFVVAFLGRWVPILNEIGKFMVVGVLNTVMDWGALAALPLLIGIAPTSLFLAWGGIAVAYYSFYKSVSFIIALTNSYFWNKYWVFPLSASKARTEFAQFVVVSVVGFAINVALASLVFAAAFGIAVLTESQRGVLGAAVATIASMAWNFAGYKFFVFHRKSAASLQVKRE